MIKVGMALVAVFAAFTALAGYGVASINSESELIERGDLFVKFDGGISPERLPRRSRGPISVRVAGTIKTLSGNRPPALRFISIAINHGGSIDTQGLPRCHKPQLLTTTSRQAMQVCGPALVGHGRYEAAVALPEQNTFPLKGRILAFNAFIDGRRAILAHVFGSDPFPNTRLIVFHIRQTHGTFGTVLDAQLPVRLNRYGYLKQISLNLHRTYFYRGQRHSYLGAECAAPAGLRIGIFAFSRVGMTFSDGRKLASTLTRSCTVEE
jgi:hypothetical protein